MSYGYRYNYHMGADEALTFFLGFFGIMITFAIAIGLAIYLFNAIGLYNMSKRRGYKNAWLAFIPVANSYVLGGIADNINSCTGKKTHHRTTLLILDAVTVLSSVIVTVTSIGFLINIAQNIYYYDDMSYSAVNAMIGFTFITLALSAVAIAYMVFYYICCYKIFTDYSNNNGALFLVLSILFGIAPFVIFALRNKDSISLNRQSYGYQQGQPIYQQPGQPMYQQTPPQNGWYNQAPQQMYQQAPQPIQQNGWYQQAPQPPVQPPVYQAPQQPVYTQTPPQQPTYPQAPQTPPTPVQPTEPQANDSNDTTVQ